LTAKVSAIKASEVGTVVYDSEPPAELIDGNSDCNEEQSIKIDDSIVAALIPLQRSLDNKSDELWLKWFGEGSAESDADV
jgi:hypothetical protein